MLVTSLSPDNITGPTFANLNFLLDRLYFVIKRKPILLVDNSEKSQEAISIFKSKGIEYVEYDIRKFIESCCGDLPTTKTPSVFAPEGIFKGLEGVKEYVNADKKNLSSSLESESAYW